MRREPNPMVIVDIESVTFTCENIPVAWTTGAVSGESLPRVGDQVILPNPQRRQEHSFDTYYPTVTYVVESVTHDLTRPDGRQVTIAVTPA